MADFEVSWESPPDRAFGSSSRHGPWWRRLEPLIERPGEWARVATGLSAARYVAKRLTEGKTQTPPGNWEFVSADDSIWARYLGKSD